MLAFAPQLSLCASFQHPKKIIFFGGIGYAAKAPFDSKESTGHPALFYFSNICIHIFERKLSGQPAKAAGEGRKKKVRRFN